MHAEEADNFLNLAAALKTILARAVLIGDLPRAEFFLMQYLQTYLKVNLVTYQYGLVFDSIIFI